MTVHHTVPASGAAIRAGEPAARRAKYRAELFPDTNRSRDVLEALLRETDRAGAALVADCRVLDVQRVEAGF